MANDPQFAGALKDYEVVLGVTGGIAVYKSCSIASALVQRGAGVTCVMTRAARRFVRPLSFEALTGRAVLTSLWRPAYSFDPQHIRLTERADLFIIAPATANIIAKIAHGLADDLLSTLLTAVTCPVLIAPAMNNAMWANKVVQRNVAVLHEFGYRVIGPAEGWLACRSWGPGRMEEPQAIVETATDMLRESPPKQAAQEQGGE